MQQHIEGIWREAQIFILSLDPFFPAGILLCLGYYFAFIYLYPWEKGKPYPPAFPPSTWNIFYQAMLVGSVSGIIGLYFAGNANGFLFGLAVMAVFLLVEKDKSPEAQIESPKGEFLKIFLLCFMGLWVTSFITYPRPSFLVSILFHLLFITLLLVRLRAAFEKRKAESENLANKQSAPPLPKSWAYVGKPPDDVRK